ncbi:MAG: sodium/glutamate symporter [Burkholderiaceae bacterium]
MISLTAVDSLLLACLVLLIGRLLTSRVGFLARYSIPDPVVGGLLCALGVFALTEVAGLSIEMDTDIRSIFLLVFFSCIGLTADLRLLKRGGPRLIVFVLVVAPFLFLQNIVGLGMAWLLDMHPLMGLLAGSITMTGGHGTGAAYAVGFAELNNIQDVMALAMMSATIGLVMGGVVGGPVAEWLLRRYKVRTPGAAAQEGQGVRADEAAVAAPPAPLDTTAFIGALAAVFVCLAVGELLAILFADVPVNIPDFLWCLMTGIVIRNVGPLIRAAPDDRASDILGNISLSLFLAMSMMTIDLASAMLIAGPLVLILLVQTVVCMLYAAWVVFRVMRKDYEAVVISAAFCGFGLGTTATAIANMQALARRHGHAPEAFIVVPITGAFLVDIMNVMTLTVFISLPFIGGF